MDGIVALITVLVRIGKVFWTNKVLRYLFIYLPAGLVLMGVLGGTLRGLIS